MESRNRSDLYQITIKSAFSILNIFPSIFNFILWCKKYWIIDLFFLLLILFLHFKTKRRLNWTKQSKTQLLLCCHAIQHKGNPYFMIWFICEYRLLVCNFLLIICILLIYHRYIVLILWLSVIIHYNFGNWSTSLGAWQICLKYIFERVLRNHVTSIYII